MAAMTLDTIMIKIESDATKATGGIDKLATSLTNLRNATKGGFNNLQKLSTALNSLNKASVKLSETTKQLDKITTITSALNQLSSIETPKGLVRAVDNLSKLPGVMNKITPKHLENVTRVSNQLAEALTPLSNKLAQIGQGMSALSQLADKYGVSVTKVREYTKQTHDRFKTLSSVINGVKRGFRGVSDGSKSFGKTALTNLTKVHSKVKQIALSLLGTRTLFTAVRKAVSEYMTMDKELTDSISNAWRALGAQLAPAIEYVIHLFTQLIRVVYSIVKALTGVDLIARANAKAMASWGKSSKDTLGQLQKFDDLNVVEFDKNGDDNKLIDLDEIDLSPIKKILDLVRKIKEEMISAFNTGQWTGVGVAIADLLNYSFSKINAADIKKMIRRFTKPVVDTLNGIIGKLNWTDFGEAISTVYKSVIYGVTELIKNIDFKTLGNGVIDLFTGFDPSSVLHSWYELFSTINAAFNDLIKTLNSRWSDIKKEAKEVGYEFANIVNGFLHDIDWVGATKAFAEGLNTLLLSGLEFISNFDWTGLGETFGNVINTLFSTFDFSNLGQTISDFVVGLVNTVSSFISTVDWGLVGAQIVTFILEVDWGKLAVSLLEFMENLCGALLDAAAGVGITIGQFLKAVFTGNPEEDTRTFGEKLGDAMTRGMAEQMRFNIEHNRGQNSVFGVFSFLKGFIKELLGIHSPSKWAKDELGENISLGLYEGLKSIWSKSKNIFEDFVTKTTNWLSSSKFKTIGSNIVSGIKAGLNTLTYTLNDMFRNALNGVVSIINNMISKINSKLTIRIGSTLSDILSALGVNVSGGYYQLFSIPSIPKLNTGTNEIPQEGIYHLHPGEAVVPKKYNPALGNGGSEETNQKLDTLIYLMENMNFTNVVNVGNETLYKKQQAYNKMQNDKYGTTVNI